VVGLTLVVVGLMEVVGRVVAMEVVTGLTVEVEGLTLVETDPTMDVVVVTLVDTRVVATVEARVVATVVVARVVEARVVVARVVLVLGGGAIGDSVFKGSPIFGIIKPSAALVW